MTSWASPPPLLQTFSRRHSWFEYSWHKTERFHTFLLHTSLITLTLPGQLHSQVKNLFWWDMCQDLATVIYSCTWKHPCQIPESWAWLNGVFFTFSLISCHEEGIAQLMNLSVLSICCPHRKPIIFRLIILFSAFIVSLKQCYFLIKCIKTTIQQSKVFFYFISS